jgi:hypothetical protein
MESVMTYEFCKWAMIALLCITSKDLARQNPSTKSSELLSRSDFAGIIKANPMGYAPQSDWRQFIDLNEVDSLKGNLARDMRTKEYPWIRADYAGSSEYPTCFAAVGEYLVFLRLDKGSQGHPWSVIAAFPVEYQPDDEGRIMGGVIFDKANGKTLDIRQARLLIQAIASGGAAGQEAASVIDPLLQSAISTGPAAVACAPPSHQQRIQQARRLVSKIKQGTTRADIEKMFPQEDGGFMVSGSTRYYLGSEVMVEMSYDQTGGAWAQQNKLNGPIMVYRSLMHMD